MRERGANDRFGSTVALPEVGLKCRHSGFRTLARG
jgi:hypothetical protein